MISSSAVAFGLERVLVAERFGCKADPKNARAWFLISAEAGHPDAVLSLAYMLKEGVGGAADPEGALHWYLIAQKAGLRANGLEAAVMELKAKLSESQAQEAERSADAWLAARIDRKADEAVALGALP